MRAGKDSKGSGRRETKETRICAEETNVNLKQNSWCAVRDANWTPHERQSTASLLHERNVDCLRH
jgi:hypothetical protein